MFLAISILLVGTLFFSSLVTPVVYSALELIMADVPWPFSRVYDRVAMVFTLIFVILYRKRFNLKIATRFFKRGVLSQRILDVVVGIAISLSISLVALYMVVGGNLQWADKTSTYYAGKILKVIPAALLISLIEESFFRVLVFRRLQKSMQVVLAAASCSLLYAFVHFISPDKSYIYPGYSLSVGFDYLLAVFDRMLLPGILPAGVGLFLVGMTLCYVIYKTQSLYLCIGLHAGWVMAIKMANYSTEFVPGVTPPPGIGKRYFLVADPIGWTSIILVFVALFLLFRNKKFGSPRYTGKPILFASLNRGKYAEVREVADDFGVEIIYALDVKNSEGASPPEVEESGETYSDNSFLKSEAFFKWSEIPTLADDSGLEVKILGGEPGVKSSRYAGEPVDSERNIDKLLNALSGEANRSASFKSVLCFQSAAGQSEIVSGEIEGEITQERHGAGGFGYDSVFRLLEQGKTLAELKEAGQKIETHRTKALIKFFSSYCRSK